MTARRFARTHGPVKLGLLLATGALLVSGCGAAGADSTSAPRKVSTAPVVHSRAATSAPVTPVPTGPCAAGVAGAACSAPNPRAAVTPSAPVAVDAPDQVLPGADLPVVTIRALADATVSESDDRPCSNISAASIGRGELEVRRTGAVDAPLTVRFTTAGTATSNGDYEALPNEVTIPAGAAAASVLVTPTGGHGPAPLHLHRSSTLALTLADTDLYDVGAGSTAEIALHFDFDLYGCVAPPPPVAADHTDRPAAL